MTKAEYIDELASILDLEHMLLQHMNSFPIKEIKDLTVYERMNWSELNKHRLSVRSYRAKFVHWYHRGSREGAARPIL